nr:hypothetical protein [Gracilariopsis longissima]
MILILIDFKFNHNKYLEIYITALDRQLEVIKTLAQTTFERGYLKFGF